MTKKKVINQYESLKKNSDLIKQYYKDDSIKLEKILNENLKKFNYY